MFTTEQIEEIKNKIVNLYSKKTSELPSIESLMEGDKMPVLHNGEDKIIPISILVKEIQDGIQGDFVTREEVEHLISELVKDMVVCKDFTITAGPSISFIEDGIQSISFRATLNTDPYACRITKGDTILNTTKIDSGIYTATDNNNSETSTYKVFVKKIESSDWEELDDLKVYRVNPIYFGGVDNYNIIDKNTLTKDTATMTYKKEYTITITDNKHLVFAIPQSPETWVISKMISYGIEIPMSVNTITIQNIPYNIYYTQHVITAGTFRITLN